MDYKRLYNDLETLEEILIDVSTSSDNYYTENDYSKLRLDALCLIEKSDQSLLDLIPGILKSHRSLKTFWNYIKKEFKHYSDRRTYIHEEFSSILYEIERKMNSEQVKIINFNNANKYELSTYVEKIKNLINNGYYDSAITASKTLVQTTEKIIIKEVTGQTLNDSLDTDNFHSEVMKKLNLDPSKDYDKRLKQIIEGLNRANSGLAQIRNVASDAHAPRYKAEKHHAKLAANTAITICEFLIDTLEYQKTQ